MKIICIGRNYRDHAKELNNPVPKKPLVFMKPPSALLINKKPFYYPDFSSNIHYEAEVVLKITKNGKYVQPAFAKDYFAEVALGIDFTARDLQSQCKEKGHPWEIAKGFDGSAVLSEFVPFDKVDQNGIEFTFSKNGEIVQRGNTNDLIFPFEYLIQYVSQFFKLQMGDLIFTGTPAGVGPVKPGDILRGDFNQLKEEEPLLYCEVK
ncbi:MAG: fumarylacetoacetate hydrolase family protein [Saprospiraceae bacterium]|nr:fumarylacetoacetate hydrolase family protein [Saprospiraceae bacterium]